MATQNTVNVGINVSDNGTTQKQIKNANALRQAYDAAAASAANVNTGGTAGSRKVASGAYSSSSGAVMSEQTYGNLRGSAGATGAQGRDFANQAQGLGGLVRLYATYAANVFAVGAAFRALSNAMDTANMVRGLDQLGAQSGTALGSLSKRLAAATGDAISLREAMEATAKASQSGMSSDQILRMGKVAKQAAQTLGVDMADAISRISRGITKLEPELLDELGLFTKTGKAAEDYAKSVGKQVTSLTDFERRAAFANAVLAEGEKKFGAINLENNPYQQLAAQVKNLQQTGLELVNKVLTPIVSLLASNPTALGAGLAAVGVALVKQALPALGQFKAELARRQEEAYQKAIQKAEEANQAKLIIDKRYADAQVDVANASSARLGTISKDLDKVRLTNRSKFLRETDFTDLSESNVKAINKEIQKTEELAKQYKVRAAAATDAAKAAAYLNKQEILSRGAAGAREQLQAEIALQNQHNSALQQNTLARIRNSIAGKAQDQATKANLVSTAAYTGGLLGTTVALQEMRAAMVAAGMSTNQLSGKLLLARGAVAAFGAQVGTVLAFINPAIMAIMTIITVIGILDTVLSSNEKAMQAFDEQLDRVSSQADNFNKTIDVINSKPFAEQVSETSLQAKANAFAEVTTSLSGLAKQFEELKDKQSGWDKGLDSLKQLVNLDQLSKFADQQASGIFSSLRAVAGSPEFEKINKTITEQLNIDTNLPVTVDTIKAAIKDLGDKAPTEVAKLSKALEESSKQAQIQAAKGTELAAQFAKLAEQKRALDTSFLPKDDISKFGQGLLDTYSKLTLALDDPKQKLNAIVELSNNLMNVPGTSSGLVIGMKDLAEQASRAKEAQAKLIQQSDQLITKQNELAKLIGNDDAKAVDRGEDITPELTVEKYNKFMKLRDEIAELKRTKSIQIDIVAKYDAVVSQQGNLIRDAQLQVFKTGQDIFQKTMQAEWAKAGNTITQAYAQLLQGTEAGIKLKAKADQAVIAAQIEQVKQQQQLTLATRALEIALKERDLRDMEKNADARDLQSGAIPKLREEIASAKAIMQQAQSGNATKGQSKKYAEGVLANAEASGRAVSEMEAQSLKFLQNMESSNAAIANLQAQLGAIQISTKGQLSDLNFQNQEKALKQRLDSLAVDKDQLEAKKQYLGETNAVYIAEKQAFEIKAQAIQQEIQTLAISKDIAKYKIAAKDNQPGAAEEVSRKEAELASLNNLQQREKQLLASKQLQDSITAKYSEQAKQANDAFAVDERRRDVDQAQVAATLAILQAKKQAGIISEQAALDAEFELNKRKDQLTYEQQIAQAKKAAQDPLADLNKREELINAGAQQDYFGTNYTEAELAALAQIKAEREKINTSLAEGISKATQQRDVQLQILEINKQSADSQLRWNEALTSMAAIGEQLTSVFGDVGQKIGNFGTALLEQAKAQEEQSRKVLEAKTALAAFDDRDDGEDKKKAVKDLAKAQSDQAKQELNNNIKLVQSAKSMFKEKTVAHKALAAVEKVLHIQKLAMDMKEMVQKLFTDKVETAQSIQKQTTETATQSTGFMARIGTYISEIYAKFTATLGPWGMAAAAAAVAAIFGGMGGGGSKSMPAITSEMRQETQGQAMGYDASGNKVQVRRGVFGDLDAKSESIANSIEILKNNSVDGLSVQNNMLNALRKISNAVESSAKQLYRIPGVIKGTGFGTKEGTKSSGIQGLFGSTTSTSIIDSGLKLSGTFKSLTEAAAGSVSVFEVIQKTKKKSGFLGFGGSTRTSISTKIKDAGIDATSDIQGIFLAGQDLLYSIADTAKVARSDVDRALENLSVDELVSLRGLSGEELNKALQNVFSAILDDATSVIFTDLVDQYAKFGEGALETVTRVLDTNQKVSQALDNIGISIDPQDYDVTEGLADAAGSLEDFLTKVSGYSDQFLTDEQKKDISKSTVTKTFAALNLAIPTTRKEFQALVNSLDLTTTSGQETFTTLMDVAPAFADITDSTEDLIANVQKTIDQFDQFIDQLTKLKDQLLLGSSSTLSPLEKYRESKRQLDETYNLALSGDKDAQSNLSSAIQTFLDAQRNFNASGSQYIQDFNSTLSMLDSGVQYATSEKSQAELQLDELKQQTTQLSSIDTATTQMASALSTIETAVTQSDSASTTSTSIIETALTTIANALTQSGFLGVQTSTKTVQGYASGGYAPAGVHLVGELGPELVDFSSPGRVYTASQTEGMFNTGSLQAALIAEVQKLQKQIEELRKEQQQQTGDIIVSNYDANNKVATELSQAITNAETNSSWVERSAVSIK